MKNKNLGMFFSVIVASLVALGAPAVLGAPQNVDSTADVGNVAPTVDLLDVPSTVTLTGGEMNNTFEVTCQYTDDNNISDIDKSASYLAFGDGSDYNKTFSNAIVSYTSIGGNGITENATITVESIPYYESPTAHDVTCYVEDASASSDFQTNTTTINSLQASDVNVSSVAFGSLSPGGTGTSETFKVENMGNVLLNSSWEGTDYSGTPGSFGIGNADIDSTSFGVLGLQTTAQYYGQIEVENDTTNPNRLYEPNFGLTIPLGTPQGSYSNTMTHSITQA